MFIWIALFIAILAVSFILALRSMGDFKESPSESKELYSLFLIRNPQALTAGILDYIYQSTLDNGLIVSLELLFKGDRSALVIYGPQEILQPLSNTLELLELEDYSFRLDPTQMADKYAGWEMGVKRHESLLPVIDFEQYIPRLKANEQFWWQVLIRPEYNQIHNQLIGQLLKLIGKDGGLQERVFGLNTSSKDKDPRFQTVIRSVIWADDHMSIPDLKSDLVKLGNKEGLAMLPQANTSADIVKHYQYRTFPSGRFGTFTNKEFGLTLMPQEILHLVGKNSASV